MKGGKRGAGEGDGGVEVTVVGLPIHCGRPTVVSHVLQWDRTSEFHFHCPTCGLTGPRDVIERHPPPPPRRTWRV